MSLFLYKLFLFLYAIGIRVAALWNPKARLWIKGRINWSSKLKNFTETLPENSNIIWMHCASLGEFEQGRPVLEEIKKAYPESKIILSFFSPSGYEIRKNYSGADYVTYLPADSRLNASKFLKILKPKLVIWVKYEYWYYFLRALKKRNIPVLLVSALFRPSQPFFKWYGALWVKMLNCFNRIFVQNIYAKELLEPLKLQPDVIVAGDTRFDRVINLAENNTTQFLEIEKFCASHKVMVAGSTWEDDEIEWTHFIQQNPTYRFIMAPHEVHPEHISSIMEMYPEAILYSELLKNIIPQEKLLNSNLLIIDSIGILNKLYAFATVCYIGGGFGEAGIHNSLEAAVYGKPVLFGPVYEKFAEAVALVERGAAFSISTPLELEDKLNYLLTNENALETAGKLAKDYVYEQQGASKIIMEYIYKNRLLII